MGEKRGGIVVVGSLTVDFTAFSERLPDRGETVLGTDFTMIAGGKGNNQAVAAARLGGDVSMVGCVGDDELAPIVLAGLAEAGIASSGISVIPGSTGIAHIEVDSAGDNRIVMVPLANSGLTPAVVDRHRELLLSARVVLCQLEVPVDAVVRAFEIGREGGALCVLNPAPAQTLPAELLALCDILIPNETELAVLSGGDVLPNVEDRAAVLDWAVRSVARWFEALNTPDITTIVTLGRWGAVVVSAAGQQLYEVEPVSVVAVDSTAAGDAFCGGLVKGLADGLSLNEALDEARISGGLAVTKRGALSSLPTADDVAAFKANR